MSGFIATRAVVITEHSDGNESVGEMWKETHVFPLSATLEEVFQKVQTNNLPLRPTRRQITITIPHPLKENE